MDEVTWDAKYATPNADGTQVVVDKLELDLLKSKRIFHALIDENRDPNLQAHVAQEIRAIRRALSALYPGA